VTTRTADTGCRVIARYASRRLQLANDRQCSMSMSTDCINLDLVNKQIRFQINVGFIWWYRSDENVKRSEYV